MLFENKWTGGAADVSGKVAFVPIGVHAGSKWTVRIGERAFEIEAASDDGGELVTTLVSIANEISRSGGKPFVSRVYAGEHEGLPAVFADGVEGKPVDMSIDGKDKLKQLVHVECLQEGRVAGSACWIWNVRGASEWVLKINGEEFLVDYDCPPKVELHGVSVWCDDVRGLWQLSDQDGVVESLEVYSDSYNAASYTVDVEDEPPSFESIFDFENMEACQSPGVFCLELGGNVSHLLSTPFNAQEVIKAIESIECVQSVERIDAIEFSVVSSVHGKLWIVGSRGETREEVPCVSSSGVGPKRTVRLKIVGGMQGVVRFHADGKTTDDIPLVASVKQIATAVYSAELGWSLSQVEGGVYVFERYGDDPGVILADVSAVVGCTFPVRKVLERQTARNGVWRLAVEADASGSFVVLLDGDTKGVQMFSDCNARGLEHDLQAAYGECVSVSGPDGGPFIVQLSGGLASANVAVDSRGMEHEQESLVRRVELRKATGCNWWTNPANWSLGRVPNEGDAAIFESGPSCLYSTKDVVAGCVVVRGSYRKTIDGLVPGERVALAVECVLSDGNYIRIG